LLDNRLRNLSGERKKFAAWYSIGKDNLKEDSRFSVPIVAECGCHSHDLRMQGPGGFGDGREKLRLMSEGLCDVHEAIIPHPAANLPKSIAHLAVSRISPWGARSVSPARQDH
jgi:hypothetical protein